MYKYNTNTTILLLAFRIYIWKLNTNTILFTKASFKVLYVLKTRFFFLLSIAAFTKVTRINSTDYEVKLVDTAGQDEYSIFPAQYSMDFHGYVLVYSITSQKSFEVIQIIYEKLLDVMGKSQWVIFRHLFYWIFFPGDKKLK